MWDVIGPMGAHTYVPHICATHVWTYVYCQDGRNPVTRREGQEVGSVVKSTGRRGLKASLDGVRLKAHW